MKRYFFLAITCFALIIASCSSDDDDDISTTKNYLKVKGVEYDLNDIGTLQVWIYRSGLYETTLFLHSGGPSGMNGQYVEKGDVILFDIKSSSRDGLDSGIYTIDLEVFEGPQYIIERAYFETESSWVDDKMYYGYGIDIQSGKLEVSRSGNIYSITINCSGENGEKITGFFKGPLYIINDHIRWNN